MMSKKERSMKIKSFASKFLIASGIWGGLVSGARFQNGVSNAFNDAAHNKGVEYLDKVLKENKNIRDIDFDSIEYIEAAHAVVAHRQAKEDFAMGGLGLALSATMLVPGIAMHRSLKREKKGLKQEKNPMP